MSKRNRHRRRRGPPPGVPSQPRFKQKKEPRKFNFSDWYKPIHEAIQRGLHVTKPETDEATLVITTAAIFEKMLEFMIVLNFGAMPNLSDFNAMFQYPGPLASFAAKINLCFLIGHLPAGLKHDLDIVRDIRNSFCHSLLKRSFSDHDIAQACGELKYGKGIGKPGGTMEDVARAFKRFQPAARAQYTLSCLVILAALVFMYMRKFYQLKAFEPLKDDAATKARETFDLKLAEILEKVRTSETQDAAHPAEESNAPENTQEEPVQSPRSSPGSVVEALLKEDSENHDET
jgi:DNA-binding MltR family transcriptional regulator